MSVRSSVSGGWLPPEASRVSESSRSQDTALGALPMDAGEEEPGIISVIELLASTIVRASKGRDLEWAGIERRGSAHGGRALICGS
jgi:hypothetical protein